MIWVLQIVLPQDCSSLRLLYDFPHHHATQYIYHAAVRRRVSQFRSSKGHTLQFGSATSSRFSSGLSFVRCLAGGHNVHPALWNNGWMIVACTPIGNERSVYGCDADATRRMMFRSFGPQKTNPSSRPPNILLILIRTRSTVHLLFFYSIVHWGGEWIYGGTACKHLFSYSQRYHQKSDTPREKWEVLCCRHFVNVVCSRA